MTIIEKTRELGKLIQEDSRYIEFYDAARANDNDPELQKLIGEFNLKRMNLNQEMQKENKDGEVMTALDDEIREIYQQIMANKCMARYNDAKEALDSLLKSVNYIISASANGQDPFEVPEQPPQSCSGSCASCGGCG